MKSSSYSMYNKVMCSQEIMQVTVSGYLVVNLMDEKNSLNMTQHTNMCSLFVLADKVSLRA